MTIPLHPPSRPAPNLHLLEGQLIAASVGAQSSAPVQVQSAYPNTGSGMPILLRPVAGPSQQQHRQQQQQQQLQQQQLHQQLPLQLSQQTPNTNSTPAIHVSQSFIDSGSVNLPRHTQHNLQNVVASDHPAALSSNTTTPTTNIIANQSFVPTAATATVPAPASTLALAPASAVAPGQQTNTFNTNASAPSGPVTAARTEQQRGTASRAKTSNFTTAGKALMLEAILKYRPYMLLAKDMWALYEVIADELNETGQCQTSSRHCRRNLVNLFDEYASNPLGVAEMFGGEHTQAAKNMKRIYEEMTGKAEAPADELLHQNEALQRLAGISGHDAGGDNDVEHDGDGSENAKTVTPDSAANRQSSKATLPSQSTVSTPAGQVRKSTTPALQHSDDSMNTPNTTTAAQAPQPQPLPQPQLQSQIQPSPSQTQSQMQTHPHHLPQHLPQPVPQQRQQKWQVPQKTPLQPTQAPRLQQQPTSTTSATAAQPALTASSITSAIDAVAAMPYPMQPLPHAPHSAPAPAPAPVSAPVSAPMSHMAPANAPQRSDAPQIQVRPRISIHHRDQPDIISDDDSGIVDSDGRGRYKIPRLDSPNSFVAPTVNTSGVATTSRPTIHLSPTSRVAVPSVLSTPSSTVIQPVSRSTLQSVSQQTPRVFRQQAAQPFGQQPLQPLQPLQPINQFTPASQQAAINGGAALAMTPTARTFTPLYGSMQQSQFGQPGAVDSQSEGSMAATATINALLSHVRGLEEENRELISQIRELEDTSRRHSRLLRGLRAYQLPPEISMLVDMVEGQAEHSNQALQ